MVWNSLASLDLTQDWQFTNPVGDAEYFRLRAIGAATQLPVRIGQVQQGNPSSFFGVTALLVTADYAIVKIPNPLILSDRRLALKVTQSSLYKASEVLSVEVELMPMTQNWINADLEGGWAPYPQDDLATASYWKDLLGIVHLRGAIGGGDIGGRAFLLPTGYRPEKRTIFSVMGFSTGSFVPSGVQVYQDGGVQVFAGSTEFLSLDGISFRAF